MRKATDLRCWAFVTAWQRGRLGYSLHGDDSLVGALRVADTRRDVPPLQLADLTKLVHLSHRLLHLTPSLLVHFGLGGGRRLLPSHSKRPAAAATATSDPAATAAASHPRSATAAQGQGVRARSLAHRSEQRVRVTSPIV